MKHLARLGQLVVIWLQQDTEFSRSLGLQTATVAFGGYSTGGLIQEQPKNMTVHSWTTSPGSLNTARRIN
jgi:hypothetical protein